jgi:hypothetical protein
MATANSDETVRVLAPFPHVIRTIHINGGDRERFTCGGEGK